MFLKTCEAAPARVRCDSASISFASNTQAGGINYCSSASYPTFNLYLNQKHAMAAQSLVAKASLIPLRETELSEQPKFRLRLLLKLFLVLILMLPSAKKDGLTKLDKPVNRLPRIF